MGERETGVSAAFVCTCPLRTPPLSWLPVATSSTVLRRARAHELQGEGCYILFPVCRQHENNLPEPVFVSRRMSACVHGRTARSVARLFLSFFFFWLFNFTCRQYTVQVAWLYVLLLGEEWRRQEHDSRRPPVGRAGVSWSRVYLGIFLDFLQEKDT